MKDKAKEIRAYFETMVVYKVSSVITILINYQIKLLTKSKTLSPRQMSSALGSLDRIKRTLGDLIEKI